MCFATIVNRVAPWIIEYANKRKNLTKGRVTSGAFLDIGHSSSTELSQGMRQSPPWWGIQEVVVGTVAAAYSIPTLAVQLWEPDEWRYGSQLHQEEATSRQRGQQRSMKQHSRDSIKIQVRTVHDGGLQQREAAARLQGQLPPDVTGVARAAQLLCQVHPELFEIVKVGGRKSLSWSLKKVQVPVNWFYCTTC